jgi:hypothetical protein
MEVWGEQIVRRQKEAALARDYQGETNAQITKYRKNASELFRSSEKERIKTKNDSRAAACAVHWTW